jgi:hypothetical protein
MRYLLRKLFAATLLCLALPCIATPQPRDGTDLWIAPEESGWGLNLFHQGATMFAALFVYGNDGRPRWYTASNLELVPAPGDRPVVYSGALVESTGPALGSPFDPSRVTRRRVGTMSVELGSEGSNGVFRRYADVNYDVDGVRVYKHTYPFSFVAMGLTGSYTGYIANPSGTRDQLNMNIVLNGGSFAMSSTGSINGSCTYSGQQTPNGSLFNVHGTFSCNNNTSGLFDLFDVDVTRNGFTAGVYQNGLPWTDLAAQRTSSNIRGDGYTTDLWLAPNESGWGLNIIEQGDTLFGTLFVYDNAGQSHWYSASNLDYEQCAPADAPQDCYGRYRGAVVESTGPYFGTSFNAATVQRRQVGSMSIDFIGNDTAYLTYTINGVSVSRMELRRFGFRTNSLAGSYSGHMNAMNGNSDRGVMTGPMTIEISDSGDSIVMTTNQSGRTCTMRGGTRFQYGRQVMASGSYDCGAGTIGNLLLFDVYPTNSGFTGAFELNGYPIGRIEAVRVTPH